MNSRALVIIPAVFMLLLAFPPMQAEADTYGVEQLSQTGQPAFPPPPYADAVDIFESQLDAYTFELFVTNPIGNPEIFAFGVRNDAITTGPWIEAPGNGDAPDNWAAPVLLNQDQWDGIGGYAPFMFRDRNGAQISTSSLGNFRDLFGPVLTDEVGIIQTAQVAFYFDDDDEQGVTPVSNPLIGDGNPRGGFKFAANEPQSPFSTFHQPLGGTITIVARGETSTVIPLPASAWMGLGLLGVLGAVRRYRRRRAA